MDIKDLPQLTPQQNEFVFHYCSDCYLDRRKAYIASYNCQNSSEETIYKEASKLVNHPHITPWIEHYMNSLQKFQEDEIKYSRRDFFEDLERIRSKTEDYPKTINIALKAVELKGRAAGHLDNKLELSGNASVTMGNVEVEGQVMQFNVGAGNENKTTGNSQSSTENAADDNKLQ